MSVTIDAVAFRRRLHALQRDIKDNKQFDGVNSIMTILGKGDSTAQGVHTSVLHIWLLGYPFANTAITITPEQAVIVTSAKQAKHLEGIKSPSVEIWIRSKEAEESKETFSKLISKFGTGKIGHFEKDTPVSSIADAWKELFTANSSNEGVSLVDVTSGFDTLTQNKDEDELKAIRTASKASMGVMTQYFADEMTTIVDDGTKITHAEFSNKISETIDNERLFKKFKLGSEFDAGLLDWAYAPIVQSGSTFDLSPSATSNDDRLRAGVIYSSIGLRYKFYSSSIARTYLIDPTREQEQNYTALLSLQKKVIASIKDGVKCSEIYNIALEHLKEKDEPLIPFLRPSVGYGVGIEAHESGLDLVADNHTLLRDGMTLCIQVGFENLKTDKDKSYSLVLADTVRVTGDAPIVFTDSPRNKADIAFSLAQDDEPVSKPSRSKSSDDVSAATSRASRSSRAENREAADEPQEIRIQNHQRELKSQLQERGVQKYADESSSKEGDSKPEFKKYESYKRETQLPQIKDLRISLDTRAQTIIVPISGRPVPFHINSYKNGSKNEEGEYVYLRLNFNSPDVGTAKKDDVPYENPQATFLKSITLRSRDTERMNETFRKISEMKREATRRESERKEMEDVVQQDNLVEVRDRRPLRLEPLFVRPMPEGKRMAGSLEIHKNGVRYQSPLGKEQQVDILFSNVDNLFFQPSDNELIVIIHFHLKNPIMIGKRKTQDVQFYRDATDVTFDDTGNRKRRYRYGDEDELEQEQEERRMRAALNKEFKAFSEQISKATNGKVDVDIPFRELGFHGAPFRSSVFLQPTTDCLVQLVDTPFLVVKLADVEVVYLERVQFGLREFDMVFIYKDYSKTVTHINTIPVSQLDSVKDWLNEMDIPFYQGPVNMKWPVIMKTIQSDPHDFYQTGGWSFLGGDDDDEVAAENGEEVPEEESEFAVSSDALNEDSDSFDEAESEEDFEENSFDEEEESGEDWDDLEEEAAREDSRKEKREQEGRRR